MNIGEEICGEWLRHVEECEFIQYNLKTPDVQGEIDVIGLNMKTRTVYACEVAIHLTTGLQYVKDNQRRQCTSNCERPRFRKDVAYVRSNFEGYCQRFMFWSAGLYEIKRRGQSTINLRMLLDDRENY